MCPHSLYTAKFSVASPKTEKEKASLLKYMERRGTPTTCWQTRKHTVNLQLSKQHVLGPEEDKVTFLLWNQIQGKGRLSREQLSETVNTICHVWSLKRGLLWTTTVSCQNAPTTADRHLFSHLIEGAEVEAVDSYRNLWLDNKLDWTSVGPTGSKTPRSITPSHSTIPHLVVGGNVEEDTE